VEKYRMTQIGNSQVCAIQQDESISLIFEYLQPEDFSRGKLYDEEEFF
jgi:hypothetical protein